MLGANTDWNSFLPKGYGQSCILAQSTEAPQGWGVLEKVRAPDKLVSRRNFRHSGPVGLTIFHQPTLPYSQPQLRDSTVLSLLSVLLQVLRLHASQLAVGLPVFFRHIDLSR